MSLQEAADLTGLSLASAAAALARLRRAGQMVSPHRGLYVAVPPQYRTWRVVPAVDLIDAMMTAIGRDYYVALLSAAELHGASHQRPAVFQVMVDRPVADRDLERVRLRFFTHTRLTEVPTELRNSATGQVRLSTPVATCLDLASRPNDAGGLSNVATVVGELVEESGLRASDLLATARMYPLASLRRLGWLLELTDTDLDIDALAAAVSDRDAGHRPGALLDPAGPRRGHGNTRWGVVENTAVEPDL